MAQWDTNNHCQGRRAASSMRVVITTVLCFGVVLGWAQGPTADTRPVWHITDLHLDPYYRPWAPSGQGCYCEMHHQCPRVPVHCRFSMDHAAGIFGNSEGNCATPERLFASALAWVNSTTRTHAQPLVLLTGDFAEAGASYSCGPDSPAKDQIVGLIAMAFDGVRKALPNAKVFGCLGNHDSAPGDVFDGGDGMAWLYQNLTEKIWAPELAGDAAARATVLRGGYYCLEALPGLRVLAINTNYWTPLNPLLQNTSSAAFAEGLRMMVWMESCLDAAALAGDKVYLLGHIPPRPTNWLPERHTAYRKLVAQYRDIIIGQFYGR